MQVDKGKGEGKWRKIGCPRCRSRQARDRPRKPTKGELERPSEGGEGKQVEKEGVRSTPLSSWPDGKERE